MFFTGEATYKIAKPTVLEKEGKTGRTAMKKKKKTIMKAFISRELGGLMIISNELIFHAFLQLFMKKEA